MSGKVAEIQGVYSEDDLAKSISTQWDNYKSQRHGWEQERLELRNYLFATDTTTTTNSKLPWKNKTTLPKLTQIRDNLHANYLPALGRDNPNWFRWTAADGNEENLRDKIKAITGYVRTKWVDSGAWDVIDALLWDYIDYGTVFAEVVPVRELTTDAETGEVTTGYIGPKIIRTDPLSHVCNPTAIEYRFSPKITRYVKTLGEFLEEVESNPEKYDKAAVDLMLNNRQSVMSYSQDDVDKALAYTVDGFGSFYEYLGSDFIEILEFEGSIYDKDKGVLHRDKIITVADRSVILRNVNNPSWIPGGNRAYCVWRKRPNNLYGMGPLDNLVGMQYRIDHLENLKADAEDLVVHPPLKVIGDVSDFVWQPGERIIIGIDGDVAPLTGDLNALITAQNDIENMERKMEEFAGAPRETLGIRSPGEKTKFEVQTLATAASRVFQDKIANFEVNVMEPLLNMFLEVGRRLLDDTEIVKVLDDELGLEEFLSVTKEDLRSKGKLVPQAARHHAMVANLAQNLLQIGNSIYGQDPSITTHVSGKALAKVLYEDIAGLDNAVRDNIRIMEQTETQRLAQQAQDQVMAEGMVMPDEQ